MYRLQSLCAQRTLTSTEPTVLFAKRLNRVERQHFHIHPGANHYAFGIDSCQKFLSAENFPQRQVGSRDHVYAMSFSTQFQFLRQQGVESSMRYTILIARHLCFDLWTCVYQHQ